MSAAMMAMTPERLFEFANLLALAGWIALGVGVLILICYLYVYRRKAGSHHNKFS